MNRTKKNAPHLNDMKIIHTTIQHTNTYIHNIIEGAQKLISTPCLSNIQQLEFLFVNSRNFFSHHSPMMIILSNATMHLAFFESKRKTKEWPPQQFFVSFFLPLKSNVLGRARQCKGRKILHLYIVVVGVVVFIFILLMKH